MDSGQQDELPMARALDGITLLDLTTGRAGALAAMMLGEQGARVIKVVDADAQANRHGGYLVWDRGKEWVRLPFRDVDVNGDGDFDAKYRKLIQCADVLISDFAPSDSFRRLADYGALQGINPALVACAITAAATSLLAIAKTATANTASPVQSSVRRPLPNARAIAGR